MMIGSATRAKVAKLLPLLSSDKDGEVANTARAIGRALVAAGNDWHDLTDLVRNGQVGPQHPDEPPAINREDALRMCRELWQMRHTLREKDAQFILSIGRILKRGRLPPTAKQAKYILDIGRRHGVGL